VNYSESLSFLYGDEDKDEDKDKLPPSGEASEGSYYNDYIAMYGDDSSDTDSGFTKGLKSGVQGFGGTYYALKSLATNDELDRQRAIQVGDRAPKGESFVDAYKEGDLGKLWEATKFAAGNGLVSIGSIVAGGGVGGAAAKAVGAGVKAGVTAGVMAASAPQNVGEAVTKIEDKGAALFAGTVTSLLDALPVMGVFKKMGIADDVAKKVTEEAIKKFGAKETIKKLGKDTGTGFLQEGGTEALQDFVIDATKNYIGESPELFSDENIKGWIDSGVSGAVAGGGISAGASLIGNARSPGATKEGASVDARGDVSYSDALDSLQSMGTEPFDPNAPSGAVIDQMDAPPSQVAPLGQPMQTQEPTVTSAGEERSLSEVTAELSLKDPKEAMSLADELQKNLPVEQKAALYEAAAAPSPLNAESSSPRAVDRLEGKEVAPQDVPELIDGGDGPVLEVEGRDSTIPIGDPIPSGAPGIEPESTRVGGESVLDGDGLVEDVAHDVAPNYSDSLKFVEPSWSVKDSVQKQMDTIQPSAAKASPEIVDLVKGNNKISAGFSKKTLQSMRDDGADPSQVNGVIREGRLEFNPERIKTKEDLRSLVAHESSHLGMSGMLGGKLNQTLDKVSKSKDHVVKNALREAAGQYTDQLSGMQDVDARRLIASEAIAKLSEKGVKTNLMQGVIQRVKRSLKDVTGLEYSESDVSSLIASSANYAQNKGLLGDTKKISGAQYSMDNSLEKEKADLISGNKFNAPAKEIITLKSRLKKIRENLGADNRGYQIKRFEQNFIDQFSSFKNVLKDKDAWQMSHLTEAHAGATEAIIDHGTPILEENVITINKGEKSFSQILGGLKGEGRVFMKWVAGNRAERLKGENKEKLFSREDISLLKSLNEGTMSDGAARAPAYAQALKDFQVMQNRVNQVAVDTGLMSKEAAKQYSEEGFYVPFNRRFEDGKHGPFSGGSLEGQYAFKELKGADIPLNDLITNTVANWDHVIHASLKNQAALKAIDTAVSLGIATKAKREGKRTVTVRRGGVEEMYDIAEGRDNQLVLDSLTVERPEILDNPIIEGFGVVKNLAAAGITASVKFKLGNLVRDTIQTAATGMHSAYILPNVIRGWKATKADSQTSADMMAGGGIFTATGWRKAIDDPTEIQRLIDKKIPSDKAPTIPVKSWRVIKALWRKYDEVGARFENVNRASEYVALRKKGKSRLESNWRARDVTDFTRVGILPFTKTVAKTALFVNARVQGMSKVAREARNPEQRKQFYAVATAYTAASAGMYMAIRDDDDYKDLSDSVRDMNHIAKIPGTDFLITIPRAFELGTVTTIVERSIEQFVDDEVNGKLFIDRLQHAILETLNLNPMPHALRLKKQIQQNRSDFTQFPIESMSMMNKSKVERKDSYTSSTAEGISRAIDLAMVGDTPLSPAQVDFLIHGLFGWAGDKITEIADGAVMDWAMDKPDKPANQFIDKPVVKEFLGKFIRPTEGRSSKHSAKLYDRKNKYDEINGNFRGGSKRQITKLLKNHVGAIRVTTDKKGENHYKYKLSPDAGRVAKVFSDVKTERNNALESTTLTPEQKREIVNKGVKYKNDIARDFTRYMQHVDDFYDNYKKSDNRVAHAKTLGILDRLQAESDKITKRKDLGPAEIGRRAKLELKRPLWKAMADLAKKENDKF